NRWATRAVEIKAPPPALPVSASPATVCKGAGSAEIIVTGTSTDGSGFFDPGDDPGGPGFANHLSATASGGVVVNSATFIDPTTSASTSRPPPPRAVRSASP